MAISQTKYIEIVSGVGGEATASRRELIARVLTSNALAPYGKVLEMNSDGVVSYFGSASKEASFASKYFGFISKSATQANKISYARYSLEALAPVLRSTKSGITVAQFTGINDGSMTMTIGGVATELTGLDFTACTSLSDVAGVIQTAIQAVEDKGEVYTSGTVAFKDSAFVFTGGATGAVEMSAATSASSGTDVSGLLGWNEGNNPIVSDGSDGESLTEAMTRIAGLSNNFGSFACVDELTNAQKAELAAWNATQNYMYLYSCSVEPDEVSALVSLVDGTAGCGVTLDKYSAYAEYMPMSLLATTAYNAGRSAVKNYMYQQFDSDKASVTSDTDADKYDALKVNYLGTTQSAGSMISFYQDGYLMDGTDMAVYCNEIWLKDAIVTEFMNLLLGLEMLPANEDGRGLARGAIQGIIDEALVNGVIQAGKELTNTQKAYITTQTSDSDAWRDVQTNGYWLDVEIENYVENSVSKYKVNYKLIYSKGDSIRKVEGNDILI